MSVVSTRTGRAAELFDLKFLNERAVKRIGFALSAAGPFYNVLK